jgi:hypothetical protein
MTATLYKADGTREEVTPKNGNTFTWDEMSAILGCRILEPINTGDPSMMMIGDDEARCRDEYTINREATRIFREGNGVPNTPEGARQYFNEVMADMGDAEIFVGDRDEEPYTIVGDVLYMPSAMMS